MNFDDADERSASAGEYVLGTLSAAERETFDAALQHDAALQAEVYVWQDRLLGMARRVAPVAAAPGGWAALEARLGMAATRANAAEASGAGGSAAAGVTAAATPVSTQPVTPAANDALWQRLRRWQWASGVALAASVMLATLLVLRGPVQPVAAQRYLAVLQSPTDQATGWIVEATAGGQVRLIPAGSGAALPVPAGKSLQFWTKAEGAAGPTSLGLVAAGTTTSVPVSRMPTLGPRQLFEVTLEPEAGSPLGRPTGPVLYLGRTVVL